MKKLFDIGVAGLTLMVPFLAAYIGYSISDRSALAPSAIGAWVGASFGAGFFGAIIAGLLGGIIVFYLKKIPVTEDPALGDADLRDPQSSAPCLPQAS
ncbi:EIIBC-Fru [Serratia fonticola]|uniref:EIIBC-Fru n=1 Tax=Serratia fonticola TaxID=47917 RepID=A0A4U9U1N0_SERFO|nr:EIIBC-Fru [Serratia fonticola]